MAASIIGQLSVTTSVQDVVFISNHRDFLRFAIVTTANVVKNAFSTSSAVAYQNVLADLVQFVLIYSACMDVL